MVEFCPDCGKPLQHRRMINEVGKSLGFLAYCTCGFNKSPDSALTGEPEVLPKEELGKGIVDSKNASGDINEGFPHICSKCGHEWADVDDLGISYSDESSIHLFRCRKCGHTERHAEGTGNS